MRAWVVRNRWALPVIVVMVGLILGTVTYPTWRKELGYLEPLLSTQMGQAVEFEGIQWRMVPVKDIPPPAFPEDAPGGVTLRSYVLYRDRGNTLAAVPDGFWMCLTSLVSGERRWTQTAILSYSYADEHSFVTNCSERGPLLFGIYAPRDADITAVDVILLPKSADDISDPEADPDDDPSAANMADQPLYGEPVRSPVVLRFETG
jgi:hypothetical protein